jgi:hypothetical protein
MHLSVLLAIFVLELVLCDPKCPVPNDTAPETRLRSALFCKYDRSIRPLEEKKRLNVTVTLNPRYIDIEEHHYTMKIHSWFGIVWQDRRLQWDPNDYDNIDHLVVSTADTWIPSLVLFNVYEDLVNILKDIDCVVNQTGIIVCRAEKHVSIICNLNLKNWPKDEHDCMMELGTINFGFDLLNIVSSNKDGYKLDDYVSNYRWKITDITSSIYSPIGDIFEPWVTYHMKLIRRNVTYHTSIIIPSLGKLHLLPFLV